MILVLESKMGFDDVGHDAWGRSCLRRRRTTRTPTTTSKSTPATATIIQIAVDDPSSPPSPDAWFAVSDPGVVEFGIGMEGSIVGGVVGVDVGIGMGCIVVIGVGANVQPTRVALSTALVNSPDTHRSTSFHPHGPAGELLLQSKTHV